MGKASSAKKVARAARTGGGRTRRGPTSWVWPGLMALVVVLGTAGIVYSRDQRQPDNTRPLAASAGRAGDHWHAAIGFYICGAFVPDLAEGEDPLGIHSHGDNIVHIHPFGSSAAGKRATLEVFFDSVNADISGPYVRLTHEIEWTEDDLGATLFGPGAVPRVVLAGLVGSGRSEILETIFGARKASSGRVQVDGQEVKSSWDIMAKVRRLEALNSRFAPRFVPAALLLEMAERRRRFYPLDGRPV